MRNEKDQKALDGGAPVSPPSWVIYSANTASASGNGAGYWSNDDGWTTLEGATLFADEEKVNLPITIGSDASWELVSQAMVNHIKAAQQLQDNHPQL